MDEKDQILKLEIIYKGEDFDQDKSFFTMCSMSTLNINKLIFKNGVFNLYF